MNRFLFVPLTLTLCLPAVDAEEAGLPRLAVEGRNLEITEALVSVELEGRVAEIIYEIAYQNNTTRQQEGEFSLRLPVGATVSTYAIDVLGQMRPAVSVEKERARNAYESIKRRKVDPGLVERGADNVYRNRVFPIEPKSVKRVRIGYLRELGPEETLELPLDCEGRIGHFELTVTHPPSTPEIWEHSPLPAPERVDANTWRWSASDIHLTGRLALRPAPASQALQTLRIEGDVNGTRHFVAQGVFGPVKDNRSAAWRKIRVIWDASYSGRFRDHGGDLNALDQIWQWLGDAEVTVHRLNLELSPPVVFSLVGGDGSALRDHLAKIHYDGSADYSKIETFEGVTFIVGDGIVSSPIWAPKPLSGSPIFLLNSTDGLASPGMLASVDAVLDRRSGNFLKILQEHHDTPVIEGLAPANWQIVRNQNLYRITGVIPPEAPATLRLLGGGLQQREFSTTPTHGTKEWNFSRRLWAQDRLTNLEWQRDQERILEHAMAERLASDLTSLIVLERMEDHLRYRIPPPEPDLLTDYQRRLPQLQHLNNGKVTYAWSEKLQWFNTEFPWIDTELREETAAVAIFTKASRTVFEESQVLGTNLPALEAWLPEAQATLSASTKIESDDTFGTWKTEARERFEALRAIRARSEADPDKPFWVSVRGFVKERGVFPGVAPFPLGAAITKAGGPAYHGSLSRVFLYRDGQRTGYNLESSAAAPVPLRPGDMVVVESLASAYDFTTGFGDPFADGFGFSGQSPAAGGGPSVFEPPGSAKPKLAATQRTGTFGQNQIAETVGSIADDLPVLQVISGSDRKFLDALKAHPDPADFYLESLAGDFGKKAISHSTVVEIARHFQARNDHAFAYRVLTNLCELEPNPIEATRALAIWLCELGENDRAMTILHSLLASMDDNATKALVHHDLARLGGVSSHYAEAFAADAETTGPVLSPILLTDHFAISPNLHDALPTLRDALPLIETNSMPSDLRIVVTTAGGDATVMVATPHRHSLEGSGVIFNDTDPAWHHHHPRVSEYQIRRCLPGIHLPSLIPGTNHETAMTARIDLYLHWGSKNEERRSFTIILERDPIALPAVMIDWIKTGAAPSE